MKFLDYLYYINCNLVSNNSILEKIQIKRIGRVFISIITNSILPICLKYSKQTLKSSPRLPIIVSLTSFPARINKVWMTIESIISQSEKPMTIVLWLSIKQFPNKEKDLPQTLLSQKARGLQIRFVNGDIRSHKKYYYAFREFHDSLVMTIDDDILFPSDFLSNIYRESQEHPDNVIASFGFRYQWSKSSNYFSIDSTPINGGDTGRDLFFGSGGGTLFRPSSLISNLDTIENILSLCPTADDVYLNGLVRISKCGITFCTCNPLLSIVNKNDTKLCDYNGELGDKQSPNAIQVKSLVEYFLKKYDINPFITEANI